jgi:hypothetical protein
LNRQPRNKSVIFRIVFMCAIGYSNPIQEQLLELYQKAFDALGIDFDFDVEPLSRAISLAVSGRSDGDCLRVDLLNINQDRQ